MRKAFGYRRVREGEDARGRNGDERDFMLADGQGERIERQEHRNREAPRAHDGNQDAAGRGAQHHYQEVAQDDGAGVLPPDPPAQAANIELAPMGAGAGNVAQEEGMQEGAANAGQEDVEAEIEIQRVGGHVAVEHGIVTNIFFLIFTLFISFATFMLMMNNFMNLYIAAPTAGLTAITIYNRRREIYTLFNFTANRAHDVRNLPHIAQHAIMNFVNREGRLNAGDNPDIIRMIRRLQRAGVTVLGTIIGLATTGVGYYFFNEIHILMYEGRLFPIAAGFAARMIIIETGRAFLHLTRDGIFGYTNNIIGDFLYHLGNTVAVRVAWLGANNALLRYHIERYRSIYARPANERAAIRRGELQFAGNTQASLVIFLTAGGITLIYLPIHIAIATGAIAGIGNYIVGVTYIRNTLMNLDQVALGRRRAAANCAAAGAGAEAGGGPALPLHYSPTIIGDRLAEIAIIMNEITMRSLMAALLAPTVYFLPRPANAIAGGAIGLDLAEGVNGVRVADRAFNRHVPPERVEAIVGRSRLIYMYRRSIGFGFLFTLIEAAIVFPMVIHYGAITVNGAFIGHSVLGSFIAWFFNTGIAYHFRDQLGQALNDLMILLNLRNADDMAQDSDSDSDEDIEQGRLARAIIQAGNQARGRGAVIQPADDEESDEDEEEKEEEEDVGDDHELERNRGPRRRDDEDDEGDHGRPGGRGGGGRPAVVFPLVARQQGNGGGEYKGEIEEREHKDGAQDSEQLNEDKKYQNHKRQKQNYNNQNSEFYNSHPITIEKSNERNRQNINYAMPFALLGNNRIKLKVNNNEQDDDNSQDGYKKKLQNNNVSKALMILTTEDDLDLEISNYKNQDNYKGEEKEQKQETSKVVILTSSTPKRKNYFEINIGSENNNNEDNKGKLEKTQGTGNIISLFTSKIDDDDCQVNLAASHDKYQDDDQGGTKEQHRDKNPFVTDPIHNTHTNSQFITITPNQFQEESKDFLNHFSLTIESPSINGPSSTGIFDSNFGNIHHASIFTSPFS